jgi:hypothetical protein
MKVLLDLQPKCPSGTCEGRWAEGPEEADEAEEAEEVVGPAGADLPRPGTRAAPRPAHASTSPGREPRRVWQPMR